MGAVGKGLEPLVVRVAVVTDDIILADDEVRSEWKGRPAATMSIK